MKYVPGTERPVIQWELIRAENAGKTVNHRESTDLFYSPVCFAKLAFTVDKTAFRRRTTRVLSFHKKRRKSARRTCKLSGKNPRLIRTRHVTRDAESSTAAARIPHSRTSAADLSNASAFPCGFSGNSAVSCLTSARLVRRSRVHLMVRCSKWDWLDLIQAVSRFEFSWICGNISCVCDSEIFYENCPFSFFSFFITLFYDICLSKRLSCGRHLNDTVLRNTE